MALKLISVDPGNREVKVCVPGSAPLRFASIVANVRDRQKVSLNAGSVLIQYAAGNQDLVGRNWVGGFSAKDYTQSGATYLKDKALETPKLALAAIPATDSTIALSTLYVSHPSPDLVSEQIATALQGDHQYTRVTTGGSIEVKLSIARVEVLPEGYGSVQMGYKANLLARENTVGVIDLGGGTVISSLWRDGQEIPRARVVLEKQGSYGLADMIAKDSAMQERIGARGGFPKTEVILDAIANGSYKYGTTGTDFQDLFDDYRPEWWEGIKERTMAAWAQWFEEVETILVTGGAAPLLANAIAASEGFLVMCPNSQFANCIGMLPTASEASNKALRIA